MRNIIYIGMDVHKESYTLCCYHMGAADAFNHLKVDPDVKHVGGYIKRVKEKFKELSGYEPEILCGYEAGCLGYSLYHGLAKAGIPCVILAPSTMSAISNKGVKTDKRDASNIAKCMAFGTYSRVHVPTPEDNAVKEYIRMREDTKKLLKATKQQILALTLRHGCKFTDGASYWTQKHLKWLRSLKLEGVLQETLDEYLITYDQLTDKTERFDNRIEEMAALEPYREKVKKLICFLGIKTHTALAILSEIGDFKRFENAQKFAAFLGLVPGESSSGEKTARLGITKAGNSHIRKLLVESAQSFTRGKVGSKSIKIRRKQEGNSPEVIAYADKANERLRRKYYRMTLRNGSKTNVAKTAIARELSCFVWGMMTGNTA